jgi:hypothetical protein
MRSFMMMWFIQSVALRKFPGRRRNVQFPQVQSRLAWLAHAHIAGPRPDRRNGHLSETRFRPTGMGVIARVENSLAVRHILAAKP